MKATDLWTICPKAREKAMIRGDHFRVTVLTDRLLRLEYDAEDRFRDGATQMVLCRDFPVPAFTVREEAHGLTLDTEFLRLQYDRKPFSAAGLSVTLKGAFAVYASVWHYGDPDGSFGGTARTLDEADGAIPVEGGVTSPWGFAALDDSRSMGMDGDGRLLPATPCGTDLYLFAYGHDFTGCIRDYLKLSGKVPAVPRWALGNWWSRFYPYTQDEYQALMERFRSEGIPLSVSVIDMNWHTTDIDPKYGVGWTGYSWDREKFPRPEKLLAWLHAHGLRVALNEHPADGIRPCEEMYAQMAEAMGDDPAEEKSYPYDAADFRWLAAFEKAVLTPLEGTGVDFWWIDWQQKGGSTDPGIDPLFALNHTRYLRAVKEGKAPLILSRYGGPGSQRYPVGFSGDTYATWASLAFQPRFTADASNIAYPWWSHDIGGHMHGSADPERAERWVQLGTFLPILRLHSSCNTFIEKEPWRFSPETAERMKAFLRLRHRLIPWLYTQNLLCSGEGRMLLRPLYFDWPDDRSLYQENRSQYLLGKGVMVIPVTEPVNPETGLAAAEAYLPGGLWTDFFSGRRYAGGRRMRMYRGMGSLPVLVRTGTILPLDGAEIPENGAPLPETVLLKAFPGESGEAVLLEDNGRLPEDPAYLRTETEVRMTRDGDRLTVQISSPSGETGLVPPGRRYILEMNGFPDQAPDRCSCGYTAGYDPEKRTLRLALEAEAAEGAALEWRNIREVPAFPWRDVLQETLRQALLPYDLKDRIMGAARLTDKVAFLAEIHRMGLPDSLYGAILEICTAC